MSPEAERSTAEPAQARTRPVSPSETTVDLDEILDAAGIAPEEITADVDDLAGWADDLDAAGRDARPRDDADPDDGLHVNPSEDTVDIDEALAAEGTSVAELTAAGVDAWPGASVTNADEGRAKPAAEPPAPATPTYPTPAVFAAPQAPGSGRVAIDSPELPPLGPPPRPRHRAVLPFALAAVLLLLAVAGVSAVLAPRMSGAADAAAAPAAPLTMPALPAPVDAASERRAVDPGLAFSDVALRTLAEPYLLGPDPVCAPSALAAGERERVVCDLGNGWVGLFVRMVDVDALRALRDGFVQGNGAQPGSTSTARWDFVPGPPGAKDGLEISDPAQGQGVRVRFVDERGTPRLYFDQDATLALSFLASVDPARDGDALRDYWATPPA